MTIAPKRSFATRKRVRSTLLPKLERAEGAYSQALTSLWLGNTGAVSAPLPNG